MKKLVLIFGSIAGLIVTTVMLVGMSFLTDSSDFGSSEVIGYLSMIIAFSTIFIAVKSYRDNQGQGSITFGKGFVIGLYITLIAGVIYVSGWEIYYSRHGKEFSNRYAKVMVEKTKASGASVSEVNAKIKEMAEFVEMYDNPFFRIAMTFVEILPVGIIVALVSAAILRRREILPA